MEPQHHPLLVVALGRPAELKRQVDRQLRLELTFAPEQPPRLPAAWPVHELDAGRWLVYVPREAGTAVFTQIDLAGLEDFRLHSATLEDLYLHFATGVGAPERTA